MDGRDANQPGEPGGLADAVLRARSTAAELRVTSEELLHRLAGARAAGTRLMHQLSETRSALARTARPGQHQPRPGHDPDPPARRWRGPPDATLTGESSYSPATAGAVMLSQDEAAALAAILEELAARHRADPLAAQALQAVALLRQRPAVPPPYGERPGSAAADSRRDVGDTRDQAAGRRDDQAAQRDLDARERDRRSAERGRQADDADDLAAAAEQQVRDLLWEAGLRVAAAQPGMFHGLSEEDRQAVRDVLSQARADRQASSHRRRADDQDRQASENDRDQAQVDRQHAARDRRASRADRDQAVIENQEHDQPRP